MPHLFSFNTHPNDDPLQELGPDASIQKRPRRASSLLRNPWTLLKRHHGDANEDTLLPATAPTELADIPGYFPTRRPSLPDNVSRRKPIPSLPRPQTFHRRESERREKLLEVPSPPHERRAQSLDRRRNRGSSASGVQPPLSPQPILLPSLLAPSSTNSDPGDPALSGQSQPPSGVPSKLSLKDLPPLEIPGYFDQDSMMDQDEDDRQSFIDKSYLQDEFERRWILNLSMHFRDKSNREKFFVTYAEKPNQWRRVTVSLDYRDAPDESLEAELSSLHFQRDKSFRIYEAIRESLPDIQYFDTVTNLKLETTPEDGQLHVHVREDANEIIRYPAMPLFAHINCPRFNESALEFDSHLSGFVYKVRLHDRVLIKKEIPGPDTVDEFLYEVNALDSLLGSRHVIQLEGLVTDDRGETVKGLLISYALNGALVDMIYDLRDTPHLPWYRREKWAKQIVSGLGNIHEAGFVQGDFTLSNIVIDEADDALIIDVNRRGCPVGWEPPELSRLIDSGQRIGMCIGVKTDLFQLGMVLWALAEGIDEPEREERPLPDLPVEVPEYFREMVKLCLSERPQGRVNAKELLGLFPDDAGCLPPPRTKSPQSPVDPSQGLHVSDMSGSTMTHRSGKEYIDPELAITIDEVKERRRSGGSDPQHFEPEQVAYLNPDSAPTSSTYQFDSSGSWILPSRRHRSRGRSPVSSRRRRSSPYSRTASSATSLSKEPRTRSRLDIGDGCESEINVQRGASCAVTDDGQRRLSPRADKRLTAIQLQDSGRVAELVHTDSGFDEAFDDLDLNSSCPTEDERPKTYVHEDEEPLPTPGAWHTAATESVGEERNLPSGGLARGDNEAMT